MRTGTIFERAQLSYEQRRYADAASLVEYADALRKAQSRGRRGGRGGPGGLTRRQPAPQPPRRGSSGICAPCQTPTIHTVLSAMR